MAEGGWIEDVKGLTKIIDPEEVESVTVQILALLLRIQCGQTKIEIVGDTPEQVWGGFVRYKTDDGWDVQLFMKSGYWGYFDCFVTPGSRPSVTWRRLSSRWGQ